MSLTDQQREDLRTELKALEAAEAPIMEAMEPLKKAIAGIEAVRDITCLRYGLTKAPMECGVCEAYILEGDKCQAADDVGTVCSSCAASYADIKEQVDERLSHREHFEADEVERDELFIKNYEAHIAAGGSPNDKPLYEWSEQ